MRKLKSQLLLYPVVAFILFSCKPGKTPDHPVYIPGELIFQSGFEHSSSIIGQSPEGADIIGADTTLPVPNDWVADLDGHPNIGDFSIQYQGGDSSQRLASIIEDPTHPGNHVLQYWMHRPNVDTNKSYGGKFRIQTNLYGNQDLHEIYYRVRVWFTEDWQILMDRSDKMNWFILAEYWNNAPWTGEDYPFRIHLTIGKDEGSGRPLHFGLGAQVKTDGWQEVWHADNTEYEIPLEEWLCLEIHLREGDARTGRYRLQVSGESGKQTEVFNVADFTHHPDDPSPDGFVHLNPIKGYSHRENINFVSDQGGTLRILWDDFQVFESLESGF